MSTWKHEGSIGLVGFPHTCLLVIVVCCWIACCWLWNRQQRELFHISCSHSSFYLQGLQKVEYSVLTLCPYHLGRWSESQLSCWFILHYLRVVCAHCRFPLAVDNCVSKGFLHTFCLGEHFISRNILNSICGHPIHKGLVCISHFSSL